MSDIIKIREWLDTEETEPEDGWEWPHPPICVESRIEGDLRAAILAKIGRPADDTAEVRIVESEIEGGWSEFTVEVDHDIEVWLHEGRQAQKVFDATDWTADASMAAFLKWAAPTPNTEQHREALAKEDAK